VVCGLDWVIGTHLYGYAPPIDVVNMSIQGGRLDYQENCGDILGDPQADPMQQSICTLTQMGVPVVASAGNDAINANESAPGGYDQVISVAAMTDTDGVGWENGPNAGCGYSSEQDDTFASYSNYGADIDIVAPGTCIYSTDKDDPDGDPVPMTGTSMAAPHVTGAIARYIAEKGAPGSVGEMRQLVRAAGRMDWDARTDPHWFGVNDQDPPNRVLDVAALTGAKGIKAFVYHDSFKVGGSVRNRATRVDIQRSGGYAGAVDLVVSGFPGAAGAASFDDPSLSGLGRNTLGTNLQLDFDGSGGEGTHTVQVDASGGGHTSVPRTIALDIDWTPPVVADLAPKVRGAKAALTRKGSTQVYLQWTASDALNEVQSAQLQRKIGSGSWKNAGVPGASSARVWLKPGQANKFRVKATDNMGNAGTSAAVGSRVSIRDSASGQWNTSGTWKTKKVKKAYKGSILLATRGSATLTTSFSGKAAGIAASIGPARGTFRVRVDGGAWRSVNTRTSSGGHRKVVWTARLPDGSHTLEIQRVSGQTAIDGLIIVR
jgi:subtilisin family serine protease